MGYSGFVPASSSVVTDSGCTVVLLFFYIIIIFWTTRISHSAWLPSLLFFLLFSCPRLKGRCKVTITKDAKLLCNTGLIRQGIQGNMHCTVLQRRTSLGSTAVCSFIRHLTTALWRKLDRQINNKNNKNSDSITYTFALFLDFAIINLPPGGR